MANSFKSSSSFKEQGIKMAGIKAKGFQKLNVSIACKCS